MILCDAQQNKKFCWHWPLSQACTACCVWCSTRLHEDKVSGKQVDLTICDEAHTLKNRDAKVSVAVANLPAKCRLLLSGTPVQVRQ